MMKKILMTFMLCFGVLFANAQIATENNKMFDNIGIGIIGGVSTPLDFNSMFPINPNAGIKIHKDVSPYLGFQVEGLAIFNDNHFTDVKTFVKATNVGLNSVFNLSNILFKHKERKFNISAVGGLGWFREFDTRANYLTSKTGLDFAYNIKNSQWILTPAIYWNLNKTKEKIQFNKNYAQLGLSLSYIYFFNKGFKKYDIGLMNDKISAMENDIDYLNAELAKKPNEVVKYVETTKVINTVMQRDWFIQFAKNSYELSEEAKEILDGVKGNIKIVAYASPEGSAEYNQRLSERRAAAITDYLTKKNINVVSYRGLGCINETSNRIAIVSVAD